MQIDVGHFVEIRPVQSRPIEHGEMLSHQLVDPPRIHAAERASSAAAEERSDEGTGKQRLPAVGCNAALAGSRFEGADGDEIMVADRPNIGGMQGEQSLSTTRGSDELDLERVGRMHVNDGPEVATT
jgi:hypothetical protein